MQQYNLAHIPSSATASQVLGVSLLLDDSVNSSEEKEIFSQKLNWVAFSADQIIVQTLEIPAEINTLPYEF